MDSNQNNINVTSHDQAVLTRIFNPNLPYGDTYEEEIPKDSAPGNDIQPKNN